MISKKNYTVYLFGFLLPFFTSKVYAQTVKAQVDKDRIFIGEQILLKLSLEGGKRGYPGLISPTASTTLKLYTEVRLIRFQKVATLITIKPFLLPPSTADGGNFLLYFFQVLARQQLQLVLTCYR